MPDQPIIRVEATGASITSRIVVKGTGEQDIRRRILTSGGATEATAIHGLNDGVLAKKLLGVDSQAIELAVRGMADVGAFEAARALAGVTLSAEMAKSNLRVADVENAVRDAVAPNGTTMMIEAQLIKSQYLDSVSLAAAQFQASELLYQRSLIESSMAAILADFSAIQRSIAEQFSPIAQTLKEHDRRWKSLLLRLRTYGVEPAELEGLLPEPLRALTSAKRLTEATELVDCLSRSVQLWRRSDEKGQALVVRCLASAKAELKRARADARSAGFEPGRRGRRMPIPDMSLKWPEIVRRYPQWRNPVAWPWLGDRVADVAKYLAKRSKMSLYSNAVLELTAEVLNARYSMVLFFDLNFTAEAVKARLAKREPLVKRKPPKSRSSR